MRYANLPLFGHEFEHERFGVGHRGSENQT